MFQAVLLRAQGALEKTIDNAVNSAVMAVPFVIAAGFATAALAFRLNRELGPEMGNLVMGGLFAVIGLITFAVMSAKPKPVPAEQSSEVAATSESAPSAPAAEERSAIADIDRELVNSALAALAPVALPQLFKLAMKHLPMIAVVGAALLIATTATADADEAAQQSQA